MVAITETTVSNLGSFHSFTLSKALCNSIIKYTTSYNSNVAHPTAQLQLLSYLEFSPISLWKHSRNPVKQHIAERALLALVQNTNIATFILPPPTQIRIYFFPHGGFFLSCFLMM